ncbi:MAG: hypothetical protein KF729_24170 [Sandaracinaceae bacterium]|nr:hypothetical protein [Sandaracinaceae bacterium]
MQKNSLVASVFALTLAACGGGEIVDDAGGMLGDGGTPPGGDRVPDGGADAYEVRVDLLGDGEGRVSSDDGTIDCGGGASSCRVMFPAGARVTLRASAVEPSRFAGWSGPGLECGASDACTLVVDRPIVAAATFTRSEEALFVRRSGDGGGRVVSEPAGIDCGETCSASFARGATVRLRVTPAPGSELVGWGGACAGVDESCVVRLDETTEVTVTLRRIPRALEVRLTGDGAGAVASEPAGIDCGEACSADFADGTLVTLEAVAAPGSSLAGWTGCEASGARCTLTLDAAAVVEARFELDRHPLSVTLAGAGAGTVRSEPAGIDCGAGCAALFAHGASVVLTASPDAGSTFTGWGGACSGAGAVCTVTLDQARAVTATFARRRWDLDVTLGGAGAGRVTLTPGAIDCGARCTGAFEHGASVTLRAVADASSTFVGWGGACSGAAATCAVSMTEARAVSATFALGERELTVTRVGSGEGTVVSSPVGIDCGADCTHTFDFGTTVTLSARAADSSTFDGWSGACSGAAPTCSVRVTEAAAVSASFTLRPRTLSVTRVGAGTVSSSPAGIACGADCSEDYPHGTPVTLTATAATGWAFAGWSGACSGAASTCTVTMSAARAVTATFRITTRTLSVRRAGTGAGTVTSVPSGIACGATCARDFDYGTSVTLTATPDGATSRFAGWAGACAGTASTCTVSMTEAESATATFTLLDRPLDVTVAGTGSGRVTSAPAGVDCPGTCRGTWPHGEVVVLTARAADDSTFAGWAGACSGAEPTCSVRLEAAAATTATFTLRPRRLTVTRVGSGTVASSPAGISCGTGCAADFPHGTTVRLTATPATGWVIGGWTGACEGAGVTCDVPMTAARETTLTFRVTTRALTVRRAGTGTGRVTSAPAGIDCGTDCSEDYAYDTRVTLSALPDTATSRFAGWSGACSGMDACAVTMTEARDVTATFTLLDRALDVEVGGRGAGSVTSEPAGITCPGTCRAVYPHGREVVLTARPADGNVRFAGWTGACTNPETTCRVTMTQARTVRATFQPVQRTLTVRVGAGGSVVSTPAGIDCGAACTAPFDHGQDVTLTPRPAVGMVFSGWQGACTGTGACVVRMTADQSVAATFVVARHRLIVRGAGSIGTTYIASPAPEEACLCDRTLAAGTSVTIFAQPSPVAAFRFDRWNGAPASCVAAACTFVIDRDYDISAVFR